MKELKFQVWDKEKKRMSKPFTIGAMFIEWSDGDIEMPLPFTEVKFKRFSFRQYTGLNDNQVTPQEVYGGDIVQYVKEGEYKKGYIDFNYGGFCVTDKDGVIPCDEVWEESMCLEVIGNIFENPDLIQL